MLKVGICDDDPQAIEDLQRLIGDYRGDKSLPLEVTAFQSGDELLKAIAGRRSFDLLILDIYMGEPDGIAVAKQVREHDKVCSIVFATNSREEAILGYGVHALQYLIKPIRAETLAATLELVIEDYLARVGTSLSIENRTGVYQVLLSDIVFAESKARVVTVHTRNQGSLSFYDRLDHFAQRCETPPFLRCHKSFLVNLDFVYAVEDGGFVLKTGPTVPISMRLSEARKAFLAHLARHLKPREGPTGSSGLPFGVHDPR